MSEQLITFMSEPLKFNVYVLFFQEKVLNKYQAFDSKDAKFVLITIITNFSMQIKVSVSVA